MIGANLKMISVRVALAFMASITAHSVAVPTALGAQRSSETRAEFLIYEGSRLVGRDQFSIRRSASRRGLAGITITSTVFYPADARRPSLTTIVELGSDSLPLTLRLENRGPERKITTTTVGEDKISFRVFSQTRESLRETPNSSPHLLADLTIPSLYSVLPGTPDGEISILSPRDGRVSRARVSERAAEVRTIQGRSVELRHVELTLETGSIHLWYDQSGELLMVEQPAERWRAERSIN